MFDSFEDFETVMKSAAKGSYTNMRIENSKSVQDYNSSNYIVESI